MLNDTKKEGGEESKEEGTEKGFGSMVSIKRASNGDKKSNRKMFSEAQMQYDIETMIKGIYDYNRTIIA